MSGQVWRKGGRGGGVLKGRRRYTSGDKDSKKGEEGKEKRVREGG